MPTLNWIGKKAVVNHLAVEYKGGNAITNDDSRDKMAVGAVRACRSEGKCLFVMPTNGDFSAIKKKITG